METPTRFVTMIWPPGTPVPDPTSVEEANLIGNRWKLTARTNPPVQRLGRTAGYEWAVGVSSAACDGYVLEVLTTGTSSTRPVVDAPLIIVSRISRRQLTVDCGVTYRQADKILVLAAEIRDDNPGGYLRDILGSRQEPAERLLAPSRALGLQAPTGGSRMARRAYKRK